MNRTKQCVGRLEQIHLVGCLFSSWLQNSQTLRYANLRDRLGVLVSIGTIWNTLGALVVTFKKLVHAAVQGRPDVAQKRIAWRFWQGHLHPHPLVSIDEAGASTKMPRNYGRAFRGQRVVTKVPYGY